MAVDTTPDESLAGDNEDGPKRDKNARIRACLADELLTTERTYVEALETLIQSVINPLEDRLPEVSSALDDLFRNIPVIAGLHRRFLDDLSERMMIWNDTQKIGDVFLAFAPFLRMYCSYAIQHEDGTRVLRDMRQKGDSFMKLVNEFASSPKCKGFTIESFLILPVQRLPRYQLLFQELSTHTRPDHPDYENLQNAFRQASSVTCQINEAIRDREHCALILELQSRFIGDVTLIAPSRRLIRTGFLTKICRAKTQLREFFLFNDMLIYARTATGTTNGLKLNRQIFIDSSFEVLDAPSSSYQYPFEIRSRVKSFMVLAPSQEDKVEWLLRIMECIDAYKERVNSRLIACGLNASAAPVWQPNDHSNNCAVCSVQFGLFRRRHHCRRCGSLVCSACSKGRASLDSKTGVVDRICRPCSSTVRRHSSTTMYSSISGMSTSGTTTTTTTTPETTVESSFDDSRSFHRSSSTRDDSISLRTRDALTQYAGDSSLRALADEALATVKRIASSRQTYRPSLEGAFSTSPTILPPVAAVRSRQMMVQEAAAAAIKKTGESTTLQLSERTFAHEAAQTFSRRTSSNVSSPPGALSGSESSLYLRSIMPHCNDNPSELNFEVGDVVAVVESRAGAWIWGVNVRTDEKGWFTPADMIELGSAPRGHWGCPGVANTTFDATTYEPDESLRRETRDVESWDHGLGAAIPKQLLSIVIGQTIEVVDARSLEWWMGYTLGGDRGWFPSEYVTLACTTPTAAAMGLESCGLCSCPAFLANIFDLKRCARCQHQNTKHCSDDPR